MTTETTATTGCECRVFLHQGWCDHYNPEGKQRFHYVPLGAREPVRTRDHAIEQAFLEYVCELAKHLGSVDPSYFPPVVLGRARLGAERYGDTHFLDPAVDLLAEMLEETPDVVVYPMLAIQKHYLQPGDDAYHHLAIAAAHAAMADHHARIAQRIINSE